MRAILTNFGTTGDVMPYLALAVELRRQGHHPVLALSPAFRTLVEPHGIEFAPIGPDLRQAQTHINQSVMATPDLMVQAAAQMANLFSPLATALPQMFEDLLPLCRRADVLISGRMQPASRMIHDLTHTPFVTVHGEHSGSGGGSPAFQEAVRALVNPLRLKLGLPAFDNPLVEGNSPQLVLHALSRHVRPPPADWPAHYHVTGYFFLDEADWTPDPGLVAFLSEGEPPLVVTFGSMPHEDPAAMTELLVEALRRTGRRALLQLSANGLPRRPLPPTLRVAPSFVPYSWLLPRTSCVVHHGGAGTTGTVFRAGVPQVVVPHAYDNVFWGEIVHQLGCGGPAIPYPQLTAERLASAIDAVLSASRYRAAAAALAERVRTEHGVVKARQLIEDLVARIGLSADPRLEPLQDEDPEPSPHRRRALLQRQRARKHDD